MNQEQPTENSRIELSGSNNSTFALGGGTIKTTFSKTTTLANLSITSDSSIIVSGTSNNPDNSLGGTIAKYKPDGSLDTSFDNDGILSSATPSITSAQAQSDGKAIILGYSMSLAKYTLQRINKDGTPDTSFDNDGSQTIQDPEKQNAILLASNISIQQDGKTLAAGLLIDSSAGGTQSGFLYRYNTDGSLDTSFDSDGRTYTSITPKNGSNFTKAIPQSDGKIIVACHDGSTNAIVKYNKDGSLDSSFDNDGIANVSFYLSSLATQSDGKIVATGIALTPNGGIGAGYVVVTRFNSNGSLDTSFGDNGIKNIMPKSSKTVIPCTGESLLILADGKIIVGTSDGIYCLNTSGNLETSFDGDGLVEINSATQSLSLKSIALSNDKIITLGQKGLNEISISKYKLDGSLDNGATSTVKTTEGNDVINSSTGNESIDGGAGRDTVIYAGPKANYAITKTETGYVVTDNVGTDGVDSLNNIERIKFSDKTIALDSNGNAGQAYRLYQAAFDRSPDKDGLKYWITTIDNGASLKAAASAFTESQEFATLYGGNNPSADTLITKLYNNVLHRNPDQGGYDYWKGQMASGGVDKTGLLVNFSESAENKAALIGVIQNGIDIT